MKPADGPRVGKKSHSWARNVVRLAQKMQAGPRIPRRAAKVTNFQPYVGHVPRPLAVVRFCAGSVFIFVPNFSRGISLRKSISKEVAAAAVIPSLLPVQTLEKFSMGAAIAATLYRYFIRKIPRERFRMKITPKIPYS